MQCDESTDVARIATYRIGLSLQNCAKHKKIIIVKVLSAFTLISFWFIFVICKKYINIL